MFRESSANQRIPMNVKYYFLWKTMKKYLWMFFAAVVIDTLISLIQPCMHGGLFYPYKKDEPNYHSMDVWCSFPFF